MPKCKRARRSTDSSSGTVVDPGKEAERMALSLDLVLKEILSHLEVPDLLTCSLVSRHWCFNARSVLRDQKICSARIRGKMLCEVAKNLNDLLENSFSIPFNGFSVYLNCLRHVCTPVTDVVDVYSALLSKVKVTQMRIEGILNPCCPIKGLLQNAMELKANQLKQLCIKGSENFWGHAGSILGGTKRTFPALKTLEMYSKETLKILDLTPNLKKLYGVSELSVLEALVQSGKAGSVKGSSVAVADFEKQALKSWLLEEPKLEKIKIFCHIDPDSLTPQSSFFRFLKFSQNSLLYLDIPQIDLFLVSYFTMLEFPNVKKVTILFNVDLHRRLCHSRLIHVKYPKLLPNLETVELYAGPHTARPRSNANEIKAMFKDSPGQYICTSVTRLIIRLEYRHDLPFTMLGEVYPNVKSLKIYHAHKIGELCMNVFKNWKHLESLTLCDTVDFHLKDNQDPTFCGISEEEALDLQSTKLDLQRLQYAPVRPCLTTLISLKKLRVEIMHTYRCQKLQVDTGSIFLSKVTGELAFARIPNAHIEIVREQCGEHCGFRMAHLKPYIRLGDFLG